MSTFKSTALLVAALATGAVACLVSGDAIAGLDTHNALTTTALNENALISNALGSNALTDNALTDNSVRATASRVRGNDADMVGLALNGIRVDSVRLVLPTTEPR